VPSPVVRAYQTEKKMESENEQPAATLRQKAPQAGAIEKQLSCEVCAPSIVRYGFVLCCGGGPTASRWSPPTPSPDLFHLVADRKCPPVSWSTRN